MITIEAHIKGLIFDFDGTLLDTMPLHYRAWQEIVQAEGGNFPEKLFHQLAGAPNSKVIQTLNQTLGYHLNSKTISVKKEKLFVETYLPQAQPIAPVVAIAQKYKGQLPMAVATSSTPEVIGPALQAKGLDTLFDAVVTSRDVIHGKPAPDTFLEAARRLGVDPQGCMVFEDSDIGLEAARRAGMAGVDVRPWVTNQ